MRTTALAAALLVATATAAAAFELTSPDFEAGGAIPTTFAFDGFGCTGDNLSPALEWSNAPDGTASFALLVHDPDAPTGGAGFWHWLVLDIPAATASLPRGAGARGGDGLPPPARHVRNDYGVEAYGGPCPPEADDAHRYDFTLYALPTARLATPDGATASLVGFLVNANAIATATLQGTYDR